MPKSKLGPQVIAALKAMGACYQEWSSHFPWIKPIYGVQWAIEAAVRAAQDVEEPDYKAMWEEMRKIFDEIPYAYHGDFHDIEWRHGGKS